LLTEGGDENDSNEPMLGEIREEAVITKRILDRIPGGLAKILPREEFEANPANFDPPEPKNLEEIHASFEQSARAAEEFLNGIRIPKTIPLASEKQRSSS
jgi:hypothetical protein